MTSMAVVYVSEITHSSYKQVLLSLNSVFFSIGILFATTVGSLFQWQAVNMIFFIFTAITTVLSAIFLPESPVWLTKFWVDRDYEARSSLKRIYPKNDKVGFFNFFINISSINSRLDKSLDKYIYRILRYLH